MRAALVLIVAAAGCRAYQPGAIAPGPGGGMASLDCIDVAVSPRPELRAVGPVVEIAVGNRCASAVEVDFGAIRAPGHRAFDPRDEIRPAVLDGRAMAVEVIEYRPVDGAGGRLCLDVSAMVRSAKRLPPICTREVVAEASR